MSEVISLRLNLDNPREAKALRILRHRLSEGYSTRQVITEALLLLDSSLPAEEPIYTVVEIQQTLSRINKALESLVTTNAHLITGSEIAELHDSLSSGFTASIIKCAKPGLRCD